MTKAVKPSQIKPASIAATADHLSAAQCLAQPPLDPLLTPREAASYLRVSKSYLDKLRVYGGGPKFLRPGKRKILYRKSALDVWAADRTFTSTSEYDDPRKTE